MIKTSKILAVLIAAEAAPGCVGGKVSPVVAPIVSGIEQAVCSFVEVADPSDSTYIGTVCDAVAPIVSGVLSGLSAADRAKFRASAQTCNKVQITDGNLGQGVVCDRICGAGATTADPCPAVDAKLRSARGVK